MLLCSVHKIHTLYYPCEYTKLYTREKKNEFSPQCTCEYYLETKMKKTQNVPRIKYSPFHTFILFYFIFFFFFKKIKMFRNFYHFPCKRVSSRRRGKKCISTLNTLLYNYYNHTTATGFIVFVFSYFFLLHSSFYCLFSRVLCMLFYRKTKILLRSRNHLLWRKKK